MPLNERQLRLCQHNRTDFSDLTAVVFNCSLKRDPDRSHTRLLLSVAQEIMEKNSVAAAPHGGHPARRRRRHGAADRLDHRPQPEERRGDPVLLPRRHGGAGARRVPGAAAAREGARVMVRVTFPLTADEAALVREWFEAVQDLLEPGYLGTADLRLARRLYEHLGMRVPNSIAGHARERRG